MRVLSLILESTGSVFPRGFWYTGTTAENFERCRGCCDLPRARFKHERHDSRRPGMSASATHARNNPIPFSRLIAEAGEALDWLIECIAG